MLIAICQVLHPWCYHPHVSFGEHLRQQREMRGISLDQIMATTKISRRLLQALEDEQFDLLPGGIFNKSYVRAYAKCVGMDEEEAVAEYLEASREPTSPERIIALERESPNSDSLFPLVPVLILVVVAAGAVGGWIFYRDHLRHRKPPPVEAVTPSQAPAVTAPAVDNRLGRASSLTQKASETEPPKANLAAGGTSEQNAPRVSEGAVVSYTSASSPFVVTVRPKDSAWVSIKADGKSVVRGIIKPPTVKTIHASDQVVFYTGNAGAVEIAFDGKDIPVSGGANDARTLVFKSPGTQAAAQVPSP